MPAGLKSTSSPIQVSAQVTESAPNTLTTTTIDLNLNALDQEVFVVTQINLDADSPDYAAAGSTNQVSATLSTVLRTSLGSIANSNVLAAANRLITVGIADAGVAFDREDPTFTGLNEDYIGIVATSNCFLNILGAGNGNIKECRVRIFGYRATATGPVYAALVQSEVLSA